MDPYDADICGQYVIDFSAVGPFEAKRRFVETCQKVPRKKLGRDVRSVWEYFKTVLKTKPIPTGRV